MIPNNEYIRINDRGVEDRMAPLKRSWKLVRTTINNFSGDRRSDFKVWILRSISISSAKCEKGPDIIDDFHSTSRQRYHVVYLGFIHSTSRLRWYSAIRNHCIAPEGSDASSCYRIALGDKAVKLHGFAALGIASGFTNEVHRYSSEIFNHSCSRNMVKGG